MRGILLIEICIASLSTLFAKPSIYLHVMEFKNEELVEREIEIADYLLRDFSLKQISEKTGLSKKHLAAHLRNMMEKLGAQNMVALKKIFKP